MTSQEQRSAAEMLVVFLFFVFLPLGGCFELCGIQPAGFIFHGGQNASHFQRFFFKEVA